MRLVKDLCRNNAALSCLQTIERTVIISSIITEPLSFSILWLRKVSIKMIHFPLIVIQNSCPFVNNLYWALCWWNFMLQTQFQLYCSVAFMIIIKGLQHSLLCICVSILQWLKKYSKRSFTWVRISTQQCKNMQLHARVLHSKFYLSKRTDIIC